MNTMNTIGEAAANNTSHVYASAEAAKSDSAAMSGTARLIVQHYRSPSRCAAVWIPASAWDALNTSDTPAAYKPLLSAVLENAAKSILRKRLESMSVFPSEIDASIFTADAIMAEATGANTEWLSKEELTQAWETSATRRAFLANPAYATNKAYRAAVSGFAELVIKLAGKTSTYQEAELDKIMVKLNEADHETEFGAFVLRRCEALRNKPSKQAMDLDLL